MFESGARWLIQILLVPEPFSYLTGQIFFHQNVFKMSRVALSLPRLSVSRHVLCDSLTCLKMAMNNKGCSGNTNTALVDLFYDRQDESVFSLSASRDGSHVTLLL